MPRRGKSVLQCDLSHDIAKSFVPDVSANWVLWWVCCVTVVTVRGPKMYRGSPPSRHSTLKACFAFLLYLLLYRFFYHSRYQAWNIDINLIFVLNPIVKLSFEFALPPCTSSWARPTTFPTRTDQCMANLRYWKCRPRHLNWSLV